MRNIKILLILTGLFAVSFVTAHSDDAPQPCIDIYCLPDTVEAFIKAIPLDIEYHESYSDTHHSVEINTPITINDQLFRVSILESTLKNKILALIAEYEFSPREDDDCLGRYANLIDYMSDLSFSLKPKKWKKKTPEKQRYKTSSGVRFEVRDHEAFDMQFSTSVSSPVNADYLLQVRLSRSHISTYESCRLAISFLEKDK